MMHTWYKKFVHFYIFSTFIPLIEDMKVDFENIEE